MRILYHHRTGAGDAQGIHIEEMIKAFRDLGHEVETVALVKAMGAGSRGSAERLWRWLPRLAPRWLFELMALAYNVYGYRSLAVAIRARRPDVIYERYALNTFCGVLVSRRFGIPLVLEVNAPLFQEQRALGKLAFQRMTRFLERWTWRGADRAIAVSEVLKELMINEGVPAEKLVVIRNGVDPTRFHPSVSGAALRRRLGGHQRPVVGFVGWFRRWHGLEMLLEVAQRSELKSRDVRLLLVGDGPASAALHRYAEDHALLPTTVFAGAIGRAEIPNYVAAMDICVQPAAPEYACPMKIVEYMAMGKCVVAPDQPNVREILEDGVSGYLFRAGDPDSLEKALLRAIDDADDRRAMGRRASATVVERRYLWEENARRVLALVASGDRRAPSSGAERAPIGRQS